MNIEFFKEHYKNGLLTSCMPVSLSLMAFIHKDESKENQELSDTPIRAIYYVAKKLASGDFGT